MGKVLPFPKMITKELPKLPETIFEVLASFCTTPLKQFVGWLRMHILAYGFVFYFVAVILFCWVLSWFADPEDLCFCGCYRREHEWTLWSPWSRLYGRCRCSCRSFILNERVKNYTSKE